MAKERKEEKLDVVKHAHDLIAQEPTEEAQIRRAQALLDFKLGWNACMKHLQAKAAAS